MIEDPEHEPVLHFLAFEFQVGRMDFLEVVRFLLRLERHHRRHTFPGHERRARNLPAGHGLAPSGNQEGPPEGAHRPNAVMHGVGGESDVACVSNLCGVLSRKLECWTVGKGNRQSDDLPTFQLSNLPPHRATNTFNLPRSNSTVHSFTPSSRSSPSTCTTSGCSGERTTSFAVLITATSRIVTCVPRMTRGSASRNRGSDTRRIRHTSILPSAGSASGAKR